MSKRGGQGRRERERSVRSLWRLIRLHEAKIAAHPDARDRPHWEIELAAFREQLEKHVRRLGRG